MMPSEVERQRREDEERQVHFHHKQYRESLKNRKYFDRDFDQSEFRRYPHSEIERDRMERRIKMDRRGRRE